MHTKATLATLFPIFTHLISTTVGATCTDGDCGFNPTGSPAPWSTLTATGFSWPQATAGSYENCVDLRAAGYTISCASVPLAAPTGTGYARRRNMARDEMQTFTYDPPLPSMVTAGGGDVTPRITGAPAPTGGNGQAPTDHPVCFSYTMPAAPSGGQQSGWEEYPCYSVGESEPTKVWAYAHNFPEPTQTAEAQIAEDGGSSCGVGMLPRSGQCVPDYRI